MQASGKTLMTLVMLAIFVSMVAIAWGYPPKSRFLPLVIGIPGIVLTLTQLLFDLFGSDQPRKSKSRDRSDQGASQLQRELVLFGYLIGLVAGVILFGFWLTIPVFLVTFLRLHERDNWMLIISLTAGAWFVLYLIFDRLLEIALHTGFVTEYILTLVAK